MSRLRCSTGSSLWRVGYVVFIFSYNEERLGGCYTDLDRAVLLPGDGQHVQLYLQDLWFRVDVCGPPLVLHTSEQVATVGTDRACLAHRLGSLRHHGDADNSFEYNVNPSDLEPRANATAHRMKHNKLAGSVDEATQPGISQRTRIQRN